jgi:hypothetical protein
LVPIISEKPEQPHWPDYFYGQIDFFTDFPLKRGVWIFSEFYFAAR